MYAKLIEKWPVNHFIRPFDSRGSRRSSRTGSNHKRDTFGPTRKSLVTHQGVPGPFSCPYLRWNIWLDFCVVRNPKNFEQTGSKISKSQYQVRFTWIFVLWILLFFSIVFLFLVSLIFLFNFLLIFKRFQVCLSSTPEMVFVLSNSLAPPLASK